MRQFAAHVDNENVLFPVTLQVQKALENRDGAGADSDMEALRFPLSCGRPRQDVDKKGQPCISIDCILHSDVVKQVHICWCWGKCGVGQGGRTGTAAH